MIDGQTAGGGTATGNALELALELLHGSQVKHPASAIVLVSDGAANAGIDVITVARQAAAEQIPIYTVALGTPSGTLPNPEPFEPPLPVPPDPQLMEQIAQRVTRTRVRRADRRSARLDLRAARHQLGSATRKREVTAAFAIGGVVLLLLGARRRRAGQGGFPEPHPRARIPVLLEPHLALLDRDGERVARLRPVERDVEAAAGHADYRPTDAKISPRFAGNPNFCPAALRYRGRERRRRRDRGLSV